MAQRIIYIINPIAGTRTKKDLQQFIQEKTKEKKILYYIFPSVASGDYSFLQSIIREERITDVVIAGGDGTVSQVVSSLMKEDVNFGIIPCGSGNGLALAAKSLNNQLEHWTIFLMVNLLPSMVFMSTDNLPACFAE
jgi:diacylglycerol kinase (ATP)